MLRKIGAGVFLGFILQLAGYLRARVNVRLIPFLRSSIRWITSDYPIVRVSDKVRLSVGTRPFRWLGLMCEDDDKCGVNPWVLL